MTVLSPRLISISNFLFTNPSSPPTQVHFSLITEKPTTDGSFDTSARGGHSATSWQFILNFTHRLTVHYSQFTDNGQRRTDNGQQTTENCQPYVASIHLDKHRATQPPIDNTLLTNHHSLLTFHWQQTTENWQLKTTHQSLTTIHYSTIKPLFHYTF
jgi:hypothetical protein